MRLALVLAAACALVACAQLKHADSDVEVTEPNEPTVPNEPPRAPDDDANAPPLAPKLVATSIASASTHSCLVDSNHEVHCWGGLFDGVSSLHGETEVPKGLRAEALALGAGFSCALGLDGKVVCWGASGQGKLDVPDERFTFVAAGDYHVCALRQDRTIRCWGSNSLSQLESPAREFVKLAVGGNHACALNFAGQTVCWGHEQKLWGAATTTLPPPDVNLVDLAVSPGANCGLTRAHTIICTRDDVGLASPPPGEFVSITMGKSHACARAADGSVRCWGANSKGEAATVEERFVALSAGEKFTCGLRNDGTVSCWGDDTFGKLDVPREFRR